MGVSLGRGARSDVTGFGVTLAIGSAATIWMGVVSWEWGAIPDAGGAAGPPRVVAADGAVKRAPDNPGGTQVPHTELEFFRVVSGEDLTPEWSQARAARGVDSGAGGEASGRTQADSEIAPPEPRPVASSG